MRPGGFEKQRPCEAGEAISPVGLCVASIFRFSKNASGRIFWVYYNFYWRSFWNTWIKPKPLGLSVISYAFNFVLVMYHIWINRIFIGKVVGAHMKFYMYPLCRCNFSGDSYPILQKFCLFVVRNHCQPMMIPASIHANIAAAQIPDLQAPKDMTAATKIPTYANV